MIKHVRLHGKFYLMEAVSLAGFVIGAALLTIFLEHPSSVIMNSALKWHPFLRRIPLGVVMGIYVAAITLLFGKKSGAFMNPAVTCGYLCLRKISPANAFFYIVAQFVGAVLAAQILKILIPTLFGHPVIDYGVTKPLPPTGSMVAFIAEYFISFLIMLVLLYAGNSKRFEKYVPLISGVLVCLYLVFETPFSGMSMNPARSFAGALAANEWPHLWIYFVAPVFGMLAAAAIFYFHKLKNTGRLGLQKQKIYPLNG